MREYIDTSIGNEQKEFEHFRRCIIDMQRSALRCLSLPDQADPFVQMREPPEGLQKEDHSNKNWHEWNGMMGDDPGNGPKEAEGPFYLIKRAEYQPADAETQREGNTRR